VQTLIGKELESARVPEECSKPAYLLGDEQEAGVLRGERVEGDGALLAHVDLEVHMRFGEDGDIALVQRRRVQHVIVTHKAREHAALEHEQRLGRARVRVEGNHAADVEVQATVRHALRVQARPLNSGCKDSDRTRWRRGRVRH